MTLLEQRTVVQSMKYILTTMMFFPYTTSAAAVIASINHFHEYEVIQCEKSYLAIAICI